MQEVKTGRFIDNARKALDDGNLQVALTKMKTGFVDRRSEARDRLPEFDQIRDQARDMRKLQRSRTTVKLFSALRRGLIPGTELITEKRDSIFYEGD